MKKMLGFIAVCSLVVFLVACGNDQVDKEDPSDQTEEPEFTIEESEKVSHEEVVVNINDVEITGEVYNAIYSQTKIQMLRYGQDIDDLDTVKELSIDALISQEVLKQDAKKVGIEVSAEEVDERLEELKSEDEDQFATFLETYQLTEDSFKNQLDFSIMYDKYVASEISVDEVTTEEIEEVYKEVKANNPDEEMPALEEVEEQLKLELQEQKQQASFQGKLDQLIEAASIEKLI